MRIPRLRISLRGMAVGVAILAVILVWALGRPYPLQWVNSGGITLILWSNGSVTHAWAPGRSGPPTGSDFHRFSTTLTWADGSTTTYYHPPRPPD